MNSRHLDIEALRVWAMFCILFGHLMAFGGVVERFPKNSLQQLFLYFVVNILNVPCALNCFALVSGYMGYASFEKNANSGEGKIKWEHLLRLEFQTLFFTVGIVAVFSIFASHLVGRQQWLKAIFPVTSLHYWYLSAYMPSLICSPLLFVGVHALPQKTIRQLLWALFILLCLLSQIPAIGSYSTWLAHDFSPHWLAFCFLLGAYLQRYGFRSLLLSSIARFLPHKRKFAVWIYLVCIVSFWFFVHAMPVMMQKLFGILTPSIWRLADYKSPLSIIGALSLFYVFLHIDFSWLKEKDKTRGVLVWLSSGSFAVYLLHCNELVLAHCVNKTHLLASCVHWSLVPFVVFFIALGYFLAGCLLDTIRRWGYAAIQPLFRRID